jgi:hypothetical protein
MASFPDSRAFLIRLSDETDPAAQLLVGRVEHVESGLRGRFFSRPELWAFIESVMAKEAQREGREGEELETPL